MSGVRFKNLLRAPLQMTTKLESEASKIWTPCVATQEGKETCNRGNPNNETRNRGYCENVKRFSDDVASDELGWWLNELRREAVDRIFLKPTYKSTKGFTKSFTPQRIRISFLTRTSTRRLLGNAACRLPQLRCTTTRLPSNASGMSPTSLSGVGQEQW